MIQGQISRLRPQDASYCHMIGTRWMVVGGAHDPSVHVAGRKCSHQLASADTFFSLSFKFLITKAVLFST